MFAALPLPGCLAEPELVVFDQLGHVAASPAAGLGGPAAAAHHVVAGPEAPHRGHPRDALAHAVDDLARVDEPPDLVLLRLGHVPASLPVPCAYSLPDVLHS